MPVRTLAITHKVEACEPPDPSYVLVLREGSSCAWHRGAECYVQTPRETTHSFIGRAVRSCLK